MSAAPPSASSHSRLRGGGGGAFYLSLVAVTVILTSSVPRTRLWNGGDIGEPQSFETLNNETLADLVFTTLLLIVSFLLLNGSDPGYLDIATMEELGKIDGIGLLGGRISGDDDGLHPESGIEMSEIGSSSTNPDRHCLLVPSVSSVPTASLEFESVVPISSDQSQPSTAPGASRRPAAVRDSIRARSDRRRVMRAEALALPPHASTRRGVCDRCHFAPPLRAHHCKHCDRCVATFDHHCFLIGTCIGERNHCRFWWFLTFQLLGFMTCISILNSRVDGYRGGDDTQEYVKEDRFFFFNDQLLVIVVSIYLWALMITAMIMWVTHSFFAISNYTSFECGKGPAYIDYLAGTKNCDMPFSKGIDANVRGFCCFRDRAWDFLVRNNERWIPILWKPPGKVVRDSEDWWNHPWENKYYSCC